MYCSPHANGTVRHPSVRRQGAPSPHSKLLPARMTARRKERTNDRPCPHSQDQPVPLSPVQCQGWCQWRPDPPSGRQPALAGDPRARGPPQLHTHARGQRRRTRSLVGGSAIAERLSHSARGTAEAEYGMVW
ncbi:hypothetical protein OH77DRAFT_1054134 [Trametes cingulata]|nr:hypothetical protein OH77DRAFT_1054134 [Trametes cingulata]